jgi:putative FmdB family regulatory protein
MPIFEYQCQACGHRFDVLQKAGEGARCKCPECGRLKLQKALSAPSFHLRGSGWRNPATKEAKGGAAKARRIGHTLDSGPPHSHDDDHSRDQRGHTHRHDGLTHSHGPGHKHTHKH